MNVHLSLEQTFDPESNVDSYRLKLAFGPLRDFSVEVSRKDYLGLKTFLSTNLDSQTGNSTSQQDAYHSDRSEAITEDDLGMAVMTNPPVYVPSKNAQVPARKPRTLEEALHLGPTKTHKTAKNSLAETMETYSDEEASSDDSGGEEAVSPFAVREY
jgi:hypothetical protein